MVTCWRARAPWLARSSLFARRCRANDTVVTRCNLSSWYVEPRLPRLCAVAGVTGAAAQERHLHQRVASAAHAADHRSPGIFPLQRRHLCRDAGVARTVRRSGNRSFRRHSGKPRVDFDPCDQEILQQHAANGCISLWCATSERAYPFVFRPRLVRGFVPCAQLIYCRDIGDLVRFAGPVGRALAWHGRPLVLIDANGPIPGLIGWFSRGRMPKYFKGPQRPRLGDLAYSEYAVLGV